MIARKYLLYYDLSVPFLQPCFEKNIELTNLLCPFCKKRIGTWCRKAKKVETLVNKVLWKKIQACNTS